MKVLVDMSLSPRWLVALERHGCEARHWSEVGNPRAPDREIMAWARANGYIVFTHDLDFGHLLALTHAAGPSVIQLRTEDVLPEAIGAVVARALHQHADLLESGALVVIETATLRSRVLPI